MFLPFWRRGEISAARYLRSLGYRIVASGYRVREGEVDLIAWDGDVLVFIEVKSRRTADSPEAAVGRTKQRRVIRAARAYIALHRLQEKTCRFDIVAVKESKEATPSYRLLRDAFRPNSSA